MSPICTRLFPRLYWTSICILLCAIAVSDGSIGSRHHQRHQRLQRHSRQVRQHRSGIVSQMEERHSEIFISKNNSLVRAHVGSTATLNCRVHKDSQFGVITWARLEDRYRPYSVLTIGDSTYTDDRRYFVSKPPKGKTNWSLQILKVNREDSGLYECQATTHPPEAIVVRLKVVEAFAEILGTNEKIIKSGSKLQLHCALKKATETPQFIFWYHGERMVNFDPGVEVTSEDGMGSTLTLASASTSDSGNYTCVPSSIRPASVLVHVLSEGKSAAAVQEGDEPATPPSAAVQSAGQVAAIMRALVVAGVIGAAML